MTGKAHVLTSASCLSILKEKNEKKRREMKEKDSIKNGCLKKGGSREVEDK